MLLLRLCPIIPFNGLNYIGGVTSVSLEEYTQALIGILPITLLWCTVGAVSFISHWLGMKKTRLRVHVSLTFYLTRSRLTKSRIAAPTTLVNKYF